MTEDNTNKLEDAIKIIEEQISEDTNAYLDEMVKQAQDRPDLFYKYMLFTLFQMTEQLETLIDVVGSREDTGENGTTQH